ncbi:MAG: hypothetical protein WC804_03555 [Sphingomonas sp.]
MSVFIWMLDFPPGVKTEFDLAPPTFPAPPSGGRFARNRTADHIGSNIEIGDPGGPVRTRSEFRSALAPAFLCFFVQSSQAA